MESPKKLLRPISNLGTQRTQHQDLGDRLEDGDKIRQEWRENRLLTL